MQRFDGEQCHARSQQGSLDRIRRALFDDHLLDVMTERVEKIRGARHVIWHGQIHDAARDFSRIAMQTRVSEIAYISVQHKHGGLESIFMLVEVSDRLFAVRFGFFDRWSAERKPLRGHARLASR